MNHIFQSTTRSQNDGHLVLAKYISSGLAEDEDMESLDTTPMSFSSLLDIKDNDCSNSTIASALKSQEFPSPQPPCAQKKNVRFSTIEFREYPICLGDNPAVSFGVPITISWDHECEYELSVQEYEEARAPCRNKFQMQMGPLDRIFLLVSSGCAPQEIKARIKETDIVRHRRQRTWDLLRFAPVQESLERIQKTAANATIRRTTKRRERALLAKYVHPSK